MSIRYLETAFWEGEFESKWAKNRNTGRRKRNWNGSEKEGKGGGADNLLQNNVLRCSK